VVRSQAECGHGVAAKDGLAVGFTVDANVARSSPLIRMRTSAMGSISSRLEGSTEWMFSEPATVITRWNHEPSLDPISMEQRNVLVGELI